ncbi:MAG: thioredoxin fold domain-containing protein [bacterium]|nr:thioredoxin fold domain-containing protein [bacterium]
MTTKHVSGAGKHLAILATILLLAATARAATLEPAAPPAAEIGRDLVIEFSVGLDGPVAADALRLEVAGGQDVLGAAYPLRVTAGDPAAGGQVRLEWAAPVAEDATPGPRDLTFTLFAGEAGAVSAWRGEVAVDYGQEWSADRISAFIERRGLPLFLVLVFGFGILMSLSPCIYPMIPITLAVIGAQSQEKGVGHGLVMSVTYVLGMALVYAVLGALSATVFSGITAYMQSPAVVGPIAVLLVVLAFSMFGAFELQAPAFLRDRLGGPGGQGRGGVVGVFAMGMVAGLVASPCVGPFLAALLVWVGTTGNWVLGFFALFTFGIGMGLLLIGVGTFPALLGSMPRSGGWMDTVKKAMGLLLLVMAFWFVRPPVLLSAKLFYPLVGGTTVLVAVFIGAFDPVVQGAHWWDRARKGIGLIVLAVGLYVLVGSFVRQGVFLPEPAANGSTVAASAPARVQSPAAASAQTVAALPAKVQWTKIHTGENVQAFLDEQRAVAKAAGQPVMIDFWAEWCIYCKKLDKDVWNVPDVVAESERFVRIKVDATDPDDAEMEAIKTELRVPGLPRVVFIDSRGEVLHGRTSAFKPAAEMLEVMRGIR